MLRCGAKLAVSRHGTASVKIAPTRSAHPLDLDELLAALIYDSTGANELFVMYGPIFIGTCITSALNEHPFCFALSLLNNNYSD